MKTSKFYLIFVVLGLPAYAAASVADIKESSFVKDSSLELGTNNILKYLDEGETGKLNVHEAWGRVST